MQGTIVQTLGLVLASNARQRDIDLEPFWPEASIFRFCAFVRFVDGKRRGLFRRAGKLISPDPNAWIERNTAFGHGARVHVVPRNDPNIPDRHSVGFVGGGPRWLIEIVGAQTSELWESDWAVIDQNAPEQRIWGVQYVRLADAWQGEAPAHRPLSAIRADLEEVLPTIAEFAKDHELENFSESFAQSVALLQPDGPARSAYHADLAPKGLLSDDAERLLAAAQTAWVFGAMGSWNDVWFEGDWATYTELSDKLFSLLIEGAAAATNSSFTG